MKLTTALNSIPVDQRGAGHSQEEVDHVRPAPEDGLVEGGHPPPVDDVQLGSVSQEHLDDLEVSLLMVLQGRDPRSLVLKFSLHLETETNQGILRQP